MTRAEQQRQRVASNRLLVRCAKDKPCADCGLSFPYYVMDLDHRDPDDKVMNIARMVSEGYGRARILLELEKCDVVCANCHRIRTYK